MESWIKLHRKILEWGYYKDLSTKTVFIHLLLKANFYDNNFCGIEVKRGQRWTSVKNLAQETGLTDKQVRGALTKLQKGEQIVIQTANNGSMITVCNYDDYQFFEKQKGKQKANEAERKGQQIKNDLNKEEELVLTWRDDFNIYLENARSEFNRLFLDENYITGRENFHPGINIKKSMHKMFADYWGTQEGWIKRKSGKSKELNWERTINNALTLTTNQVKFTAEERAERAKNGL